MLLNVLLNAVRGFAMGAADIVPGVSGGTIALILGIYERLLASLRAGSKALTLLVRRDVAGFRRWMAAVDWLFVISLGGGILVAVFMLAGILRQLLHDQPEMMAAVFIGLVAGSVVVAWRLIRVPRASHALIIVGVGALTFMLLGLRGGTSEESVGQLAEPALWAYLLAGAIAICAMILPGVSGSFLLVIMGMYAPLLAAVTDRDFVPLGVFMLGAVIGLALFSQALHLALQRWHDPVMAVLIGLMAGSMRVLWPWPDGVDSTDLAAPEGDVFVALALAAAAFVVVVVVARFAQGLEQSGPHPDAEPHDAAGREEGSEPLPGRAA
jgi:putative membrane protein